MYMRDNEVKGYLFSLYLHMQSLGNYMCMQVVTMARSKEKFKSTTLHTMLSVYIGGQP